MNTPNDNPFFDVANNPYIDTSVPESTTFTVPLMVEADSPQLQLLQLMMAVHLGRLRFQTFVRAIEADWFDDVETITLAWEWEQEARVPVPRAFGDRSQSNIDFEARISEHFFAGDDGFAMLINEHFGEGQIEISKGDLDAMVRAVVPKKTLAHLDANRLEGTLPESNNTPKPRF